MKHPHAEFLAEALKDTTRKIEARHPKYRDGDWITSELSEVIRYAPEWQFRFADTKPECVSPLIDEDLAKIGHIDLTNIEARRAIANAAHRAAYKQISEMASFKLLLKRPSEPLDLFYRDLLKQLGE